MSLVPEFLAPLYRLLPALPIKLANQRLNWE
jgi:hypothetical protein